MIDLVTFLKASAFFLWFTSGFAAIELFYWEQQIKKSATIFKDIKYYWWFHALWFGAMMALWTGELTFSAGAMFLYKVVQDIMYMITAGRLTKNNPKDKQTNYDMQDWMPAWKVFKWRIPKYYITEGLLGAALVGASLLFNLI